MWVVHGTLWNVIASREQSKRYGPGLLVVDGTDVTVARKAQFAFRPSRKQEALLQELLSISCEVYNAALQERRDAYRMASKTLSWQDQFNEVAGLRGVRDDALAFGIQPVRGAIKRCDEAMSAFFRRVKTGQTPGYPRFRSHRRYNTACWDEPTSWAVNAEKRILRLQGIGVIGLPKSAARQLGRMLERGGAPKTLSVTRRQAGTGWAWRATVGFTGVAVDATPAASSITGVDRGVVVGAATSAGDLHRMPKYRKELRSDVADLERAQARKTKRSRAWKQLGSRIARERRAAANRVDNWAWHTAKAIVENTQVIALEDLRLVSMTKSARGTMENPGTNVSAKKGLNRELQDAALGLLAVRICVKAESAGRRVWAVDPRNTSRTCSVCDHIDPGNRVDQATFHCTACGHGAHADVNAAINIAALGQRSEDAWVEVGAPPLTRRKSPRTRRRTTAAPAA